MRRYDLKEGWGSFGSWFEKGEWRTFRIRSDFYFWKRGVFGSRESMLSAGWTITKTCMLTTSSDCSRILAYLLLPRGNLKMPMKMKEMGMGRGKMRENGR